MTSKFLLRLERFGASDRILSLVLGLQALAFVLQPFLSEGLFFYVLEQVALELLMLTVVLFVFKDSGKRTLAILAVLFFSLLQLLNLLHIVAERNLRVFDLAVPLAFDLFLVYVLLQRVFAQGHFSSHRISGIIAIYLVVADLFANLYQMLLLFDPNAFTFANEAGSAITQMQYFSLVTLTSTGYGDILPLGKVARMLAMLEAISGQLFLAIAVARVVTMEMESRNK